MNLALGFTNVLGTFGGLLECLLALQSLSFLLDLFKLAEHGQGEVVGEPLGRRKGGGLQLLNKLPQVALLLSFLLGRLLLFSKFLLCPRLLGSLGGLGRLRRLGGRGFGAGAPLGGSRSRIAAGQVSGECSGKRRISDIGGREATQSGEGHAPNMALGDGLADRTREGLAKLEVLEDTPSAPN